jgi:hypothetical protein
MKINVLPIRVLLPLMLAMGVASSRASEPAAPTQEWGIRDLPKLATPSGLVNFTRDEIRSERDSLRHDVADLRAGKPRAFVELSFTGARLAGASSGAVTGARLVYHFATLDAASRAERLDTALPRTIEQAPDRGFQRAVHATLRGAVTGNWNVGSAVAGDLGGRAIELAPAALNSTHDAAQQLATDLATPRS